MRKSIYYVICSLILGACTGEEPPMGEEVFLLHSYIPFYVAQFGIKANCEEGEISVWAPSVAGIWLEAPEVRYSPDEELEAQFLEIARRNGDTAYMQKELLRMFNDRYCFADNFQAIHVTALSGSWDAEHPMGASLDDIAIVRISTYGPYVRSGYTLDKKIRSYKKPCAELTKEDLEMINITYHITFSTPPDSEEPIKIKITMVTTEGKEKSCTCMYIP